MRRAIPEKAERTRRIASAADVVTYVSEYYASYLRDSKKEFFNIILLDSRNKPIDNIEISKGSIVASVVDPKEIIREATMRSASALVLVHNHPSGEPDPSQNDIHITNQVCLFLEMYIGRGFGDLGVVACDSFVTQSIQNVDCLLLVLLR